MSKLKKIIPDDNERGNIYCMTMDIGSNICNSPSTQRVSSQGKILESVKKVIEDSEKGENYVLRYDLTVPFSRYIKTTDCNKLTRYQIGTVYRKDQPNMKSGRFREFMQCDFDILGDDIDPIAANAETLDVLYTMLNALDIQKFVIKINSRTVLEDLFREEFDAFCCTSGELWKEFSVFVGS